MIRGLYENQGGLWNCCYTYNMRFAGTWWNSRALATTLVEAVGRSGAPGSLFTTANPWGFERGDSWLHYRATTAFGSNVSANAP